jgi:hypothetical protein
MNELERLRAGIRTLVDRCEASHPILWECRRVHQDNARGGRAFDVEVQPSAVVLQYWNCWRCQQLLALLGQEKAGQ